MDIKTVKKQYGLNFKNETVLTSYLITYNNSNRVKSVPLDEANTDYQEILEWVAAGNTITDPGA
jgi:hypothetical protein